MGTMDRKGMDRSQGKAIPPAGLTQSLCPKLGSILCHSEAEPWAGSLGTWPFCCRGISHQKNPNPQFITFTSSWKMEEVK